MDHDAAETAGHQPTGAKRCADCGMEYLPIGRRGDSDDRIDKFLGLDVVSALNIVMDLIHASHARTGMSEGAFAVWNWLAGLRQVLGPEQASAREWANRIAQLRALLLDFTKAAGIRAPMYEPLPCDAVGAVRGLSFRPDLRVFTASC